MQRRKAKTQKLQGKISVYSVVIMVFWISTNTEKAYKEIFEYLPVEIYRIVFRTAFSLSAYLLAG